MFVQLKRLLNRKQSLWFLAHEDLTQLSGHTAIQAHPYLKAALL